MGDEGTDEADGDDAGADELAGAVVSALDEQAARAAPPPVRATIPAARSTVRREGDKDPAGDGSFGKEWVRWDTGTSWTVLLGWGGVGGPQHTYERGDPKVPMCSKLQLAVALR